MKITFNVESNLGYAPDQVEGITLGELLAQVEEAVMEWGEDAEVVLHQINNRYGANYGRFVEYELFSNEDAEEGDE